MWSSKKFKIWERNPTPELGVHTPLFPGAMPLGSVIFLMVWQFVYWAYVYFFANRIYEHHISHNLYFKNPVLFEMIPYGLMMFCTMSFQRDDDAWWREWTPSPAPPPPSRHAPPPPPRRLTHAQLGTSPTRSYPGQNDGRQQKQHGARLTGEKRTHPRACASGRPLHVLTSGLQYPSIII